MRRLGVQASALVVVMGLSLIAGGFRWLGPADGVLIAILVGGLIVRPSAHKEMTPGSVVPRPSIPWFDK